MGSVDAKLFAEGIDGYRGRSHQIFRRYVGKQLDYFVLECFNCDVFVAFPPLIVTFGSECATSIPFGPLGQFDQNEFPAASDQIIDSLKILLAVLFLSFLGESSEFYDGHLL